jgi:hypothetical protein
MSDASQQETQQHDIVFIPDKRRGDRYRVRIDDIEYLRSWRDPSARRPRKSTPIILTEEGKALRREYMKQYRQTGKRKIADLKARLARALEGGGGGTGPVAPTS